MQHPLLAMSLIASFVLLMIVMMVMVAPEKGVRSPQRESISDDAQASGDDEPDNSALSNESAGRWIKR